MRTELCKVTACNFYSPQYETQDKPKEEPQDAPQDSPESTKNHINPNWLSADVQAHIDPPPIPFTKKEDMDEHQTNIIKVKRQHNPLSATLKTYELQTNILENGQPEELIMILKNFKKEIVGTGTNAVYVCIRYLQTVLHGEDPREFDDLVSQNSGTTNTRPKEIQDDLMLYLPPLNEVSKYMHTMHHAMQKACSVKKPDNLLVETDIICNFRDLILCNANGSNNSITFFLENLREQFSKSSMPLCRPFLNWQSCCFRSRHTKNSSLRRIHCHF